MAYKRQTRAFAAWLAERAAEHPDAFADVVGAEAAVTAWRRHLFEDRAKPATVNQALAAVTLMYEQAGLRIAVRRARVPKPGEPDALTAAEQGAVERAAARRGVHDAAIVAVLLYAGARVEECARLGSGDVAITARTGTVRLHGKGDEVRTVPLPANARTRLTDWLDQRGREPGPLWTGQRGALTDSGITQVVLAVGHAAGIERLRPTGSATPLPPASAKAARTSPRSRPSSATPPWTPAPGTSMPAPPRPPPSSSASSTSRRTALPCGWGRVRENTA
jgi:integrase/recombinase XerC